jgi:hypothetical protein
MVTVRRVQGVKHRSCVYSSVTKCTTCFNTVLLAATAVYLAHTGTPTLLTHTHTHYAQQVIDSLKKQDKVILAIVRHDDRLQRAAAAEADLDGTGGTDTFGSSISSYYSLTHAANGVPDDEICSWTRALRRNINQRRTLCMDTPLPPGTSLLAAMGTVNIGSSTSTSSKGNSKSAQRRKSHRRSTSSSCDSNSSTGSGGSVSKKDMGKGWRAKIVHEQHQQQHGHHSQQHQQHHHGGSSSSSSRAGTAEAPPLKLVLADIFE